MPQAILLDGVTITGAGTAFGCGASKRVFSGRVAGTGAVTATIRVEVSNDGTTYLPQKDIVLSGTTSAADGFAAEANWPYVRGNVIAISGTGAAATLKMDYMS